MSAGVGNSGDAFALLANTDRWHDAMRRMGRPAVESALRRRPGRPTDVVDDVGTEPPYPTRAVCEQWCTDQDNILFQFSPRMAVVVGLFVLVFACLLRAYSDFSFLQSERQLPQSPGPRPSAMGDARAGRSGPPSVYNGPAFQPALPSSSQQQSASQLPGLQQTLQQNLLPHSPQQQNTQPQNTQQQNTRPATGP
jgi:hypothetical protein